MVDNMNSAKELNQHFNREALEKYKQKVVAVLEKDPFGLNIPQLMTRCQLSAKMLKQVLTEIDVTNNDGIYTLKHHTSPDLPGEEVTENASSRKPTFIERAIKMFKANPDGVSLEYALDTLNCMRSMFDSELSRIRKYHFPVVLEKQDDGRKLYIPQFDAVDQTLPVDPKNDPVTPVDSPAVEHDLVQNGENEPKPVPVADEYLPPEDEESALKNEDSAYLSGETASDSQPAAYSPDLPQSLLVDCKNMVNIKRLLHREVFLDQAQLNTLLQQLFDLDSVKWQTTGARVDGVHLSKLEIV